MTLPTAAVASPSVSTSALALALASGALDPAQVSLRELPAATLVWRVYPGTYGPAQYNPSPASNARFSPFEHAGALVATMYAATTVQAALMETVLRNVPRPSAGYILPLIPATEVRRVAQLRATQPLQLADLSALGLRRLGLNRVDVIECDKTGYPDTQRLAQWVYARRPDVQGVWWTSRQDDSAQALVLFEPRVAADALEVVTSDESFTAGAHYTVLTNTLTQLGASLSMAGGPKP